MESFRINFKEALINALKGDRVLWLIIAFLSLVSILIVYSATGSLAFRAANGNTAYYLLKHSLFIIVAYITMILVTNYIPVRLYAKFANVMIFATICMLIAAFIQHKIWNTPTNRSLNLRFFSFQPAEFAKISLMVFAAKTFAGERELNKISKRAYWKVIIASGIICSLVAFGDMSTAGIIAASMFGLIIVAKPPIKELTITIATIISLLILMYVTAPMLPSGLGRVQTFKERIDDYIYGDEDALEGTTQADYGALAVYSGGIFGKGIGKSDVSNYMEAAYNDFIFAILIEEYGILGALLVLFAFCMILYRGGRIASNTDRSYPAFLVVGLILIYGTQAFVNMAVAVGAFPVTGQPLPWISMGGTSMLFTALGFGMILTVSYQNNKKNEVKPETGIIVEGPNEDEEISK